MAGGHKFQLNLKYILTQRVSKLVRLIIYGRQCATICRIVVESSLNHISLPAQIPYRATVQFLTSSQLTLLANFVRRVMKPDSIS